MIAPSLQPSDPAGLEGDGGRRIDVELLEIEIDLHQRLGRRLDRGVAAEARVAEHSRQAVDGDGRAGEFDLAVAGQRLRQQARRLDLELDRQGHAVDRAGRNGRLHLELERLIAGARIDRDVELPSRLGKRLDVELLNAVLDAMRGSLNTTVASDTTTRSIASGTSSSEAVLFAVVVSCRVRSRAIARLTTGRTMLISRTRGLPAAGRAATVRRGCSRRGNARTRPCPSDRIGRRRTA